MNRRPPRPALLVTDAARDAFNEALKDAPGDSIRLTIGTHFENDLSLGPRTEDDVIIEANGITVALDPSSARRATGVVIDFVQGPTGTGFKIDNPNKPRPAHVDASVVRRACEVTMIPSGAKAQLSPGDRVVISQMLGGAVTARTESGHLVRFAERDRDALGLPPDKGQMLSNAGPFELQRVIEQLKTVFDPEIPVNIVDLGLVYACEARDLSEGGHRVEIQLSMTAPGCGMGHVLKEEARSKVAGLPGVADVAIELVWDPPWDPTRMSEAARLQLGML